MQCRTLDLTGFFPAECNAGWELLKQLFCFLQPGFTCSKEAGATRSSTAYAKLLAHQHLANEFWTSSVEETLPAVPATTINLHVNDTVILKDESLPRNAWKRLRAWKKRILTAKVSFGKFDWKMLRAKGSIRTLTHQTSNLLISTIGWYECRAWWYQDSLIGDILY